MQINKIKAFGISIITVIALMASPMATTYAADAAKKETKSVSCKKEGKMKGLKDKAELKKFIATCKKERKAAMKKSADKR